ncbi:MGDG synthase family glycosyltransferase [Paenibacillus macerans]|uniref:MGDG synthase family glycosyltransferase n=1 Tax=Paenibacillus macerans TaxID=44252 RepID=UPI003D31BBBA
MAYQSPKIIILYASYGDGHYQASKAIEAGFRRKGVPDVVLLDLMAEAHPLLNELTKFVYLQSFKTIPSLYGWVYNATKEMQPEASLLGVVNSFGLGKLRQTLKKARPDLIIHTFPQLAMPKLLKRTGQSLPLVNIVTDFDLHGRWIHPGVDRYYVPTDDMKQEMIARGIVEDRILVSGIPLKPDFCRPQEQPHKVIRQLDPGKKTVLLMAGAYGLMTGIRLICERLAAGGYQVVVVCGRNEELYRGLRQHLGAEPAVHLLGYVQDVAGLMRASDCIVTKPGGITLSEALACSLPVFIYRPVPGQELNNALYLARKGIARIARNPAMLAAQIEALLSDAAQVSALRREMENLRKPEAAEVIVNDILQQWFSPEPAKLVLSGEGSSYI